MFLNKFLNVKALLGAFNKEKALVEAFSVIVKLRDLYIVLPVLGTSAASSLMLGHSAPAAPVTARVAWARPSLGHIQGPGHNAMEGQREWFLQWSQGSGG